MGDFHASAANVHHHRRRACNIDAVDRCEVNQAGFFRAGNDLWFNAGLALDRGQEFAAVFRFAHGAGGRREDFLHLVRFGQPAKTRERVERGGHRLLRQGFAVQPPRPEADHFFFPVDHFERQIGADADHDHVNRICTAVDRRYPHLFDWKRVVRVTRTSYNGRHNTDGAAYSPPHPSMNALTSRDRLWRKRLNELSSVWPDFINGRTTGLHKTRVASRRIREALPIVSTSAPPAKVKKLNRKLRELTRYLGPIRELDVELGLLEDESKKMEGVSGRAIEILRREIAAKRKTLRDELAEKAPIGDVKKLIRKLERVADGNSGKAKGKTKHAEADAAREAEWRGVLATRLMRRGKALRTALDEAGPLYAPERIHSVRIATKKLRYAIEIAHDARVPGAAPLIRVLRRQQERLGHLHDLQLLLKHVHEAETSSAVGSRVNDLTAYADTLELECRRLHAGFVEHRDELAGCVKDVRQQLVPALATPPRLQARVAAARPVPRARTRART